MITVALIAAFFAGIFEVNAICLRYIEASKESVSAIQGVHNRIETLRNLAFSDLITESYMTTSTGTDPVTNLPLPGLLTAPADNSSFTQKVTEFVTLTDVTSVTSGDYSGGGGSQVTYTRTPGVSVTPTVSWNGGSSFPTSGNNKTTLLKVKVKYNWNATLGGRARTEETETIVSDGVKK